LTADIIWPIRFKEWLRFNNLRSQIVKGDLRRSSSTFSYHVLAAARNNYMPRACALILRVTWRVGISWSFGQKRGYGGD
jgi:hypothetical protein